MDEDSWLSGVPKEYGLASDMIHDVRGRVLNYATLSHVVVAMRRVLHLKMVTQCAMLEDFGIFLVLADKVGIHPNRRARN